MEIVGREPTATLYREAESERDARALSVGAFYMMRISRKGGGGRLTEGTAQDGNRSLMLRQNAENRSIQKNALKLLGGDNVLFKAEESDDYDK
jgi:hypothetical protein